MSRFIVNKSRVLSSNTSAGTRKYIRNPEYLDLPTLVNGNEKIYMLVKVFEINNFITLKATGDYQVDYGDGQGVQTYASGVQANYEIDWSNISSSTLTEGGFRQAIITITPQSGSVFSNFTLYNMTHPDDVQVDRHLYVVDVKIASQNITNLNNCFQNSWGIEQFEYVGTAPLLTQLLSTFYIANQLKKVVSIPSSNVTTFNRIFRQTPHLLEVPKFDLSSATNITEMFYSATQIQYLEPYDLDNEAPNITSLVNTFHLVNSLINVPITSCSNITNFRAAFTGNKFTSFDLDCSAATSVTNMFQSCSEMVSCNATFPNNFTSTTYMFDGCSNLKEIKPFNTINVTNAGTMFRSTYALRDLSNDLWDFRNTTNMLYMFLNCGIRKSPKNLGGGNLTYFAQGATKVEEWGIFHLPVTSLIRAFLGNITLCKFPNFQGGVTGTTNNSFNTMYNVSSIPSIDLSGITSFSFVFDAMPMLRESNVTGITITHSYSGTKLDRAAIVNVFNNLGTAATGSVITITNTPGESDLTTSDLLIATNKGWTVTQ
tara:strand:- start:198 stop:1826 length:1629 start_codon:yes stop_codon:yes gene_type:complete